MTDQPGGKHTRVVDDKQVAGPENVNDVAEHCVLDRAGVAMQHEQSRAAALGRRLLSDELIRKIEIEFCDVHCGHHT